ncbi:MAG: ABC transporter permease [Eubacterium sp.]|nr:ABC transporter permease [Eubacterium sp.]
MRTFITLVNRNRKLFFRDKGMLLSSLITPIIMIVLYATFLAKVYKDSFTTNLPVVVDISEKLINGMVAGQLAAALLAVSCVTVTFCVNLTMVQDRALGVRKDFDVSPIRKPMVYLGYFFSTVQNSLMVNLLALVLCLGYIGIMGWYLTVMDVALLILDLLILVLFGAVLSSIVCYPLKTQGQMSAVGTIVSAGYGFVCGAYMPISNFGEGLQRVMSYLPGTYGTALIKNHMLRGVFAEMETKGFQVEVVNGIATSLDCNPTFQGNVVEPEYMMLIMIGTVVLLGGLYLLITALPEKSKR